MNDNFLKIMWGMKFLIRRFLSGIFGIKKGNIGLVVNSFDKGGLEQVVLNLYKQYSAEGYKTFLLVQENKVGELAEYLNNSSDIYVYYNDWKLFLKFCWDNNITVLHYHYNTFGLKHTKFLGFKTIYTIHNVYTWLSDDEIKERSILMNNADYRVAVSSFVRDYYCCRTQTPLNKVMVCVNGIDFDELDGDSCHVTRQNLGCDKDDILFVNVASFHRVKHQAVLIGAMSKVKLINKKVKVLLLGNIGDDNYYKEIQCLIEKYDVSDVVRHVEYIPRSEIGDFLKNTADVFVFPSLQEGCSNAVLEALYCKLPMILTRVGNANDMQDVAAIKIISPAYNNILDLSFDKIEELSRTAYSINVDELSKAIVDMASHICEFKQMAKIKSSNAQQFTAKNMALSYLKIIK
jgi:glycosyltransferase involved in cell wall biosynthesis